MGKCSLLRWAEYGSYRGGLHPFQDGITKYCSKLVLQMHISQTPTVAIVDGNNRGSSSSAAAETAAV
eukprot:CAMPEP_0172801474 /NCGR_PEP_ID=MMETSP1075-20121228/3223_1 /TAXON_ID=2916 /ORGANISM="Ceratium fusus, Strain PA161109" /LENGTH=66 /DNA_ID=CAMNT_0013639541 /DNA_START=335 /DNA_END=535 /DNA_ORIENTATION=+